MNLYGNINIRSFRCDKVEGRGINNFINHKLNMVIEFNYERFFVVAYEDPRLKIMIV